MTRQDWETVIILTICGAIMFFIQFWYNGGFA